MNNKISNKDKIEKAKLDQMFKRAEKAAREFIKKNEKVEKELQYFVSSPHQ